MSNRLLTPCHARLHRLMHATVCQMYVDRVIIGTHIKSKPELSDPSANGLGCVIEPFVVIMKISPHCFHQLHSHSLDQRDLSRKLVRVSSSDETKALQMALASALSCCK